MNDCFLREQIMGEPIQRVGLCCLQQISGSFGSSSLPHHLFWMTHSRHFRSDSASNQFVKRIANATQANEAREDQVGNEEEFQKSDS